MRDVDMADVAVLTKNALTKEELLELVAAEWAEMAVALPPEASEAARAVVGLRAADVFDIKKAPPGHMGLGLTAGVVFTIAVKFAAAHAPALAAKFGETIVALAARELF